MEKYIAEREAQRLEIYDIPKHRRYSDDGGAFTFAGVRHIDGQTLALLKGAVANGSDGSDGSILVLPVDPATARRAARIAVGESVSVTSGGSLKTSKGRRR